MNLGALSGRVALVTGATSGIGLVTARELARQGAELVIVGRSAERAAAAVATIRAATGSDAVKALVGDLSARSDVRRVAADFLLRHDRLDVLVNNAGAIFATRRESVDGVEMTLALNHLGPFLLTDLLLPALRTAAAARGAAARVVTVSSEAHRDVRGFDFDDPEAKRVGFGSYPRSESGSLAYSLLAPMAHPGFRQYSRSKLANLLFTRELARRLRGEGIVANALHPGVVASAFGDGNGAYGWFMRRFFALSGISVEEGARTSIHVASAPETATVTGAYFNRCVAVAPSAGAVDDAAAARLWEWSERRVA